MLEVEDGRPRDSVFAAAFPERFAAAAGMGLDFGPMTRIAPQVLAESIEQRACLPEAMALLAPGALLPLQTRA